MMYRIGRKSRLSAPVRRPLAWSPAESAATVACWALAGWVLAGAARRVSVRTGVSDEEAFAPLPGDEFIAHPMVDWTRGVTARAAPEQIWPWLAQMGYGRGGWYTPQWVDLFANRWVFGVRHPFPASASRLLPEFQHVAIGDLICDGPDYASYFRVLRVDPQHALVYRSIRHPRRGSPIDITDPQAPQRVEQRLREAGTYIDFTWALVLNELPDHQTRLLVRTRANYSPRLQVPHPAARPVRRHLRNGHAAGDRQARRIARADRNIAARSRAPSPARDKPIGLAAAGSTAANARTSRLLACEPGRRRSSRSVPLHAAAPQRNPAHLTAVHVRRASHEG